MASAMRRPGFVEISHLGRVHQRSYKPGNFKEPQPFLLMDGWKFGEFQLFFYIKIWGSHHPVDSHPFINGWGSLGFQVVPCRSGTSTSWRVISPIKFSYFCLHYFGVTQMCYCEKIQLVVEPTHCQIGSLPPGIRVKMKDSS